jgi:hypothetical protein
MEKIGYVIPRAKRLVLYTLVLIKYNVSTLKYTRSVSLLGYMTFSMLSQLQEFDPFGPGAGLSEYYGGLNLAAARKRGLIA